MKTGYKLLIVPIGIEIMQKLNAEIQKTNF